GCRDRGVPVRSRRQGYGHRRPLLRAVRRGGRVVSRVDDAIRRAHDAGRGAFVGYLPAGYPDLQTSIDAAITLARNGVDVIELGPPYSDPVMDGEVIQQATQQALANG